MTAFLALGKQRQGAPGGLLASKSSQLVNFPGSEGDGLKRIHINQEHYAEYVGCLNVFRNTHTYRSN